MTIEESRRHFEIMMQWRINEATFEVIEEETCTWVAEVTTTHLDPDNISFFLLVRGENHFIIEKRWRHKLGAWCNHHL